MKRKISASYIAAIAMFTALSFVAVSLGELIPNVSGFLSYDPKDALVVIAGFAFGPLSSVLISVLVSLIEMFTISTTGLYGFVMNVFSTCSFAVPAAIVYKHNRSLKGAILGLVSSVASIVVVMAAWNWVITPLYMKVPRSMVEGMMLTVFIPFNLSKGGMNAALTMLLYKPLVSALRRIHVMPPAEAASKRFDWRSALVALLCLAAFLVLFLYLLGVIPH